MLRPFSFTVALLAVTPALAQQHPAAPLRSQGEQMRSFSLINRSGEVITSAQAHMTNGQDRVLTHESVQPNDAREIVVPRQECLDSVTVHLNNGRTLHADHLNDCKATKIMVAPDRVGVQSNINPRSP